MKRLATCKADNNCYGLAYRKAWEKDPVFKHDVIMSDGYGFDRRTGVFGAGTYRYTPSVTDVLAKDWIMEF